MAGDTQKLSFAKDKSSEAPSRYHTCLCSMVHGQLCWTRQGAAPCLSAGCQLSARSAPTMLVQGLLQPWLPLENTPKHRDKPQEPPPRCLALGVLCATMHLCYSPGCLLGLIVTCWSKNKNISKSVVLS